MEITEDSSIYLHLSKVAKTDPNTTAIACPSGQDFMGRMAYTHYTYRQLETESDYIARGLLAYGWTRGMRTLLMTPPSLDFFTLTFALFKIGAVPVFIDPAMGVKNLRKCLLKLAPEAFIGIPKAHLARMVFRLGGGTIRKTVVVAKRGFPFLRGKSLPQIRELGIKSAIKLRPVQLEPGEISAILFTSGSTGKPKGTIYNNIIFNTQIKLLKETFKIKSGEVDLCTFPLFALFAPALGMTAIIPQMDATRPARVDPKKIFTAIEHFNVTNMFGSPALLRRIANYGTQKGVKLPSIKRIISAGAPANSLTLKRMTGLLAKGVSIHTPYGATEALPITSIESNEILSETAIETAAGKGICVGYPAAETEILVVRITDNPIPTFSEDIILEDGQIGEIIVSGSQVTMGYIGSGNSTQAAKIYVPGSDKFFHRMGDVGYKDAKGRIWYCGRKSQRVVLNQAKTLYTIPCESIFNNHEAVYRTALVGIKSNKERKPILIVEPNKHFRKLNKTKLKQELLKRAAQYHYTKDIKTILFHPNFPVDIRHNSKIFREKLEIWAKRELT